MKFARAAQARSPFPLSLLLHLVNAGNDYFTTPPPQGMNDVNSDNSIYFVGQTLQLAWVTDLQYLSLLLWQNATQISATFFPNSTAPNTTWTWVVDLSVNHTTFDLSTPDSAIFILAMYDESGTKGAISPTFASHGFNISLNSSTTTTAAPSPSTQTPSANSTSPIHTTSPTATSTPSASGSSGSSGSSGLTSSQKAGIGVGVSLAALLAIAALVWFLCLRRRPKTAAPAQVRRTLMSELPEKGSEPSTYGRGELPADSIRDAKVRSQELS